MDRPSDELPEIPLGDALNQIPLFREIQRVLLASTGPVNWELARQVGIASATWGSDDPAPTDEDRRGLEDTVRAAELAVAEFTGLSSPAELGRVEAVDRARWVEANVGGLREMLEPVAGRLSSAIAQGMSDTAALPIDLGPQGADLMAMVVQKMAPLLLGAQVGAVLGYLAQRVLGQYDLAVPRPGGSLLFVVPNLARFERDWSLPAVEFRAYVALHEVTHRFEFARPWVRGHFLALVRDMVEHAELDLSDLQSQFERLDLVNVEALSEAVEGMSNVFGRSSDPEQRLRVARLQAFMAAAEGYGDHVSEAVGRRMLSSYGMIEEALRRHREGHHGGHALERLLGLEMKREQYATGAAFCAGVSSLSGEAVLARMWESPEALPSMPELEEPSLWLARMA